MTIASAIMMRSAGAFLLYQNGQAVSLEGETIAVALPETNYSNLPGEWVQEAMSRNVTFYKSHLLEEPVTTSEWGYSSDEGRSIQKLTEPRKIQQAGIWILYFKKYN